MAIEPIRSVDDALLAQTWVNAGACRSWLKRRGTTPEALGLAIVDEPPLVRLRVEQGSAALRAAAEQTPQKPAQKPADNPALPDFEAWAFEVDTLLEAANEPPASDQLLASLLAENLSPEAAMEEIVARRAAELDRSLTDPEAHCADCRPELACWGAPDRCEARLQVTAAAPHIVEGSAEAQAWPAVVYCPHGNERECDTPNECAGGANCRLGPSPFDLQDRLREQLGTALAGYHVRLASAMTREEALHLAARISGVCGVGVHVCDAHTGQVIDALVGPDRTAA